MIKQFNVAYHKKKKTLMVGEVAGEGDNRGWDR